MHYTTIDPEKDKYFLSCTIYFAPAIDHCPWPSSQFNKRHVNYFLLHLILIGSSPWFIPPHTPGLTPANHCRRKACLTVFSSMWRGLQISLAYIRIGTIVWSNIICMHVMGDGEIFPNELLSSKLAFRALLYKSSSALEKFLNIYMLKLVREFHHQNKTDRTCNLSSDF
jgi:hypothetical protein